MSASASNITVLIIEKNGDVREHVIKSFDESELYKKAGFKTVDGFKCHNEWIIEDLNDQKYNISIYGKTKGRANQENKYEFPPPIDNILFFGSCVLMNRQNGIPVSFRTEDWENVYDYLYGGFEDADDDDDDDDDEESEEDGGVPLNKYGYAKDGFVVDDEEEVEDEYETEEENEEMDEDGEVSRKKSKTSNNKSTAAKKKTVASSSSKKTPSASKKATLAETIAAEILQNVFECTSELSEEAYLE